MRTDDRNVYLEPAASPDVRGEEGADVAAFAASGVSEICARLGKAGGTGGSDESALEPAMTRARAFADEGVALVLPYPVSANRYWRTYMPRGFKAPVTVCSAEAKAYKREVAWLAKAAGIREPITGRVSVSYTLYPKRPLDWAKRAAKDPLGWDDSVACIDLDNAQKVLMDALKGVVFVDDKWVRRIEAERAEPDGNARLVVVIRPHREATPQGVLL